MEPTYEPSAIETRWYQVWEEAGAFKPEVNPDGEPFCIVIPPPNVTGVLHMGHALNHTMIDATIRRKRMQGYAALYVPGMDHAGIATQNVVERELALEGISRHDLGREKFVEQVWQWKATSGGTITSQMRALGESCDWSRERFTLDEGLSAAVREVFVTLYEQNLIYRGNRIINWCVRCATALSEIEVEHTDDPGELVYIDYPFVDGPIAGPDGEPDNEIAGITVATTRAETMLGDTAVAVHPDDPRYTSAVGQMVMLPLMDRPIPIVADDAVDLEYGTGAVKITPAHDPLDFEIAQRHELDQIHVIGTDGSMTAAAGTFAGLDRFEAREAVKAALAELGRIVKIDDHPHSVGHCSRCGTVVEPMSSDQWFVEVAPLVAPASAAVRDGVSQFLPKRWEKQYFHWMDNLHDWCISRQLWWGHRIPAWYCDACGEVIVAREDPTGCTACGSDTLRAEEDVLDTWFSSALWPFSVFGWPDQTEDLAKFYPNSTMITGFDIIFFWVARMMKMGIHFMDDRPFDDIVIHGLVRADDGRKMSKSIGNAVDPITLIESYGADSLRLSLLQAAAPGQDVPFAEDWVDAARRFGNKLWNAVRFVVEHNEISGVPAADGYPVDPDPAATWVLSRLSEVFAVVDDHYANYRFNEAVGALYNFAWSEVFDWYLEMAKLGLRDEAVAASTKQTLGVVLRDILKLLHPAMPFVTEELWSELGDGSMLISGSWPTPPAITASGAVADLQELVTGVRRFKADHKLGRASIEAHLEASDDLRQSWWLEQLAALAGVEIVEGMPEDLAGFTRIGGGRSALFVSLAGTIDVDAERARLEKAIGEAEGLVADSLKKLGNPKFVERAPEAVVAQERDRAADQEAKAAALRTQLDELPTE